MNSTLHLSPDFFIKAYGCSKNHTCRQTVAHDYFSHHHRQQRLQTATMLAIYNQLP